MVLVDTSVWIAFFRSGASPAALELDRLLEAGEACICGLMEAELLPGIRKEARGRVRDLLSAVPRLEIAPDIWVDVARIQERALDRGEGPFSIPDLVLAAVALRYKVPLFSLDKHFRVLSRLTGLRLWETSSA